MKNLLLGAIVVGTVLRPSPATASTAQSPPADARWQAWTGCWVPVGLDAISWNPATQQVCVIPASGASSVDIVTIRNNRITAREHIDANSERRWSERDKCAGWESAEWSPDARRVYLHSEYDCAGGVKRLSSGLIAMSVKGEFLHIVDVGVHETAGVRVVRHRRVPISATAPEEITAALEGRTPAQSQTTIAARAPIGDADIIEASHHVNAPIVEAWLNEAGQPFRVDAARLVRLADKGVPDRVIDTLVALSYPKAFSIKPSAASVGSLASGGRAGWQGGAGFPLSFPLGDDLLDCGLYGGGFSLYGWDPCSPYGYALYNPRYRYAPYGLLGGYGGYGGGWYLASEPTVVRTRPADGGHGQVVNGRGYSEGSGSSGSASSGGSGSSGSSGGGSGGGSSSGGGRTAQPR